MSRRVNTDHSYFGEQFLQEIDLSLQNFFASDKNLFLKCLLMSIEKQFTVAIYANEYKQICAWVLKNQTLETGGDLFGLWSDDDSAVIQLVLGPGRNCQRAVHSFYQDVAYLEKVGSNLTSNEGVCHIGEWHSHHTKSVLTNPVVEISEQFGQTCLNIT